MAGTLAGYAVLPAAAVTKKPAGLDHVTAAALPLAGAAAAQSVDAVNRQAGSPAWSAFTVRRSATLRPSRPAERVCQPLHQRRSSLN